MDLKPKTYNSKNLNSGNYETVISEKSPIFGKASFSEVERWGTYPVRGGKKFSGNVILLDIKISGVIATGIDELALWFNEEDLNAYSFVCQDLNDSNKEWYLTVESLGLVTFQGNVVTVAIHAADPIWKSVTVNSDPLSVTATGQTNNVTVLGNRIARPIYKITPTATRTGGYLSRRFIPLANRRTYQYNNPINLVDGNLDTAALVADNSNKCQINQGGGITSGATTIPYDTVTGTIPTAGRGYVDTEQISWTGKTGTTSGNLTGVVRGIGGTTAATHADNAEIKLSYIFANGDDMRVIDDSNALSEVYRWFGGGGINSATTRVFVNVYLPPKIELTLSGAMSNIGAVTTITVKTSIPNRAALEALSKAAYKLIAIDLGGGSQELFLYTGVDISAWQITGCTRAARGSSNQSHSDGATIRHVDAGYWLVWNNSSETSPTTDDNYKPMIDIVNSTNSSHVYQEFYAPLSPARMPQWSPLVKNALGSDSDFYTADDLGSADVASEMGMVIKSFFEGGKWRAPTVDVSWDLYHPAGITSVTPANGEKYRYGTKYPLRAALQKLNSSNQWTIVANETKPAVVQTWEALTALTGALSLSGTYNSIRFYFYGAVEPNLENNYAAIEVADVTVALDTNYTPLIWFGSVNNVNFVNARITNNTTAHWVEVNANCALNDTIVVDTANLKCYLLSDPENEILIKLNDESRADWLPLDPSLNSGVNQLQYNEVGVTGLTLGCEWESRKL